MAEPNPTSYVFHATVEQVHDAVEVLYKRQFRDRVRNVFSILRPGDELLSDEQRARFEQPGGDDDLYLWYMHSPMGLSEVYSVNGEPAPFVADLYLAIEPLKDGTRVSVEAIAPEVIAGKTLLPRHHMSRANIYAPVEATTVEEYRLLLGLGEALGGAEMPELRLP